MSKPIKILVISNYNNIISSRPEAEIFLELKRQGVDVEIMTDDGSEYANKFKKAGIRLIDGHPKKKFDWKMVSKIRTILFEGKHQVLLLYNSKAMINGIRAADELPVKVVAYRGYHGNLNWWDPTLYLKLLHPRVDYVICNHAAIQELLEGLLFFRKGKAITINKGHDLQWYDGIETMDLKNLGVPEGAFVCTCVANARRMKGIEYLVKAMDHLPVNLPIHLVMVGNELASRTVLKMVQDCPNKHKIHFTGFREDGLNIVKSSQVFVLASIKGESITKAVIEAMSLGIAPIITQIPGNRDLIVQKNSGLTVPPKDPKAIAEAILHMYHHPDLCKEYGKNARQRIDTQFNHKRTIREYKDFLERITQPEK